MGLPTTMSVLSSSFMALSRRRGESSESRGGEYRGDSHDGSSRELHAHGVSRRERRREERREEATPETRRVERRRVGVGFEPRPCGPSLGHEDICWYD